MTKTYAFYQYLVSVGIVTLTACLIAALVMLHAGNTAAVHIIVGSMITVWLITAAISVCGRRHT